MALWEKGEGEDSQHPYCIEAPGPEAMCSTDWAATSQRPGANPAALRKAGRRVKVTQLAVKKLLQAYQRERTAGALERSATADKRLAMVVAKIMKAQQKQKKVMRQQADAVQQLAASVQQLAASVEALAQSKRKEIEQTGGDSEDYSGPLVP
ncbi:hypothetical protein F4861DRAFT_539270 [Xylaria intraflava]|nr:hypothetical protein F4861DRAFT_539270 [Xylaria intraflava]